jgi:hypothetical protein
MEWWVYALIAAYVMVGLAFTIRAIGYNPPKSDIINNDLGGCGCLILLVLVSLFSLLVIAIWPAIVLAGFLPKGMFKEGS